MRQSIPSQSRLVGPSVRRGRRGTSAVEFAIIAPVFFLFILGIFEFGRALWVQQAITNAAREGGRQSVLNTATKSDIESIINAYLTSSNVSGQTITMDDPALVPPGGDVHITVEIAYNNVSLLPLGTLGFMKDRTLTTSIVMRKEPSMIQ